MYSVVLMMALSGGAEVPSWHGGHGCDGGYGCAGGLFGHGCNGGLFGHHRGHGCNGGLFSHHRGHGCYGGAVAVAPPPPPPPVVHGCYGGHACYGGNGCYGGRNGGHGCFGGLFHRHGGYGCCGAAPVVVHGCVGGHPMPPPPPGMKGPEGGEKLKTPPKEKKPAGEAAVAAPATIVVSLPAEARLLIDDTVTTSTSATRVFASPALAPGKDFYYTVKGELPLDGQTLTTSKQVKVRAGEETQIELEFPSATVAQR